MRSYVSRSFSRASCALRRRAFLCARPTDKHDRSVQPRNGDHSASRTLQGSPEHECEEDRGREGERGANE